MVDKTTFRWMAAGTILLAVVLLATSLAPPEASHRFPRYNCICPDSTLPVEPRSFDRKRN